MFNYFGKKELSKQKDFAGNRDKYFHVIIKPLAALGVKPDHITIFAVFLLFVGLFIIQKHTVIAGVLILFYVLLDGIDGGLARYLGIQSKRGSLMDIFADQVGVAIMPIFSVYYFGSDFIFAYLFGLGYILYIVFLVTVNSYNAPITFILRVKYPFYVIFWLSAVLNKDLLSIFYYVFGTFYILGSLHVFHHLLGVVDRD
jgi:phosphatidylglycerophosphate synthase